MIWITSVCQKTIKCQHEIGTSILNGSWIETSRQTSLSWNVLIQEGHVLFVCSHQRSKTALFNFSLKWLLVILAHRNQHCMATFCKFSFSWFSCLSILQIVGGQVDKVKAGVLWVLMNHFQKLYLHTLMTHIRDPMHCNVYPTPLAHFISAF